MSKELRHEKNCLNCGHTVEERFCSQCGQENIETKDSFLHLVGHVFEDITHFDSKFLKTIKTLFLKPGVLSQEYLEGKRNKYVQPVRLFIFTSFIFFLAQSFMNEHQGKDNNKKTLQSVLKAYSDSISTNLDEEDKAELKNAIHKSDTVIFNTGILNIHLDKNDTDTSSLLNSNNLGGTPEDYKKQQDSLPKNKRDGFFKQKMMLFLLENKNKSGEEFRTEFQEKFFHKMHYWVFILFPFFALIMKLFYRKQNMYYSEHLIFGFHLHTILLLVILLNTIIYYLFKINLFPVGLVGILLYLFFSLLQLFKQSIPKTIVKTLLVFFTYFAFVNIFLGIASILVIFIG